MLSRQDLCERYRLTDRQVRGRLTALNGLLDGHTARGDNGRELLDDYAIALFDRLMQLEADGRSTASAVEQLRSELSNTGSEAHHGVSAPLRQPAGAADGTLTAELVELLKDEISYLRAELKKRDEWIERLLPMLPAPSEPRRSWWRWWRR